MHEKVRLYLTNTLMVFGQIVFTIIMSGQVYYASENNSSIGVFFLIGWLILCLTTFGSIFLYRIASKKVSFKLYMSATVFLVLEACFVGVRYLQSSNSRSILICVLLAQIVYLSYAYTNVMLYEGKKI